MNTENKSKRRRAIVHIGMHKTGTTAIQRFINKNTQAIQRAGLHWPSEFPVDAQFSDAHHYIPWSLLERHDDLKNYGYVPQFVSSTKQRLQECPENASLLLSSEDFDHLSSSQIEGLALLLNDFDVSIILYLRRQDEFIQANYQTDVIHFNKKISITEDLNDFRLDYLALVNRWAGVFGKSSIILRVYEKTQLIEGNAVADFLWVLRKLGHAVDARIPQKRVNAGLPSAYVDLIRRLVDQGVVAQDIWPRADWVGQKIFPEGAGQYGFLSPSQRQALLARYRESNAELAQQYLDRQDGKLFDDLNIPGDDQSWQQLYGSTNALLSNFLWKVGKRLEKIP